MEAMGDEGFKVHPIGTLEASALWVLNSSEISLKNS